MFMHMDKDIKREVCKTIQKQAKLHGKIMTELRTQTLEIHELEDLDLSTVSEKGQRFYTPHR